MKQNSFTAAAGALSVHTGKTANRWLFFITAILACLLTAFSSNAQRAERGREARKTTMNFTEVANHFRAHPQPAVRKRLENEEDEMPRPRHGRITDPSLLHGRRTSSAPLTGSSTTTAYLPVSASPTDTFQATLDNGMSIPPDTHGGVDANYCVTATNTAFHIQTRSGANVSSVTLDQFWSSVLPGGGSFDPRVHYDPSTGRWFVVAVSGANSLSSSVLIAVSQTGNPTGGWWMYKVLAMPTGGYWLDFPNVGFNKKWLTVTGNLFGSGYGGAKVFIFNKAALMSGTGATYTSFVQTSSFTIAPALTYDTTQNNLFAVETWNGTYGYMHVWKITGAVGAEAMTSVGYPVGSQWQNTAYALSSTSGADFAPQSGISNRIQTNDDRVTQCVFMNNKLWFAHTVFLPYSTTVNPTRASVQWWQTDTLANPIQIGRIDDTTNANYYAFPTLAVNTGDDALIGFSTFSPSTHPSAAYAIHLHGDPIDSLRPMQVYRHGGNSYYKTYGGSRDRWGDYSATMLDPTNMTDFWTVQETVSGTANVWDTWWARVRISGCATPAITGTTTLCAGSTTTLSDALPGGTWSSSNTAVASVGATTGVVTAVSAGSATITYTPASGCSVTTTVTISAMPSAITGATSVCAGATTTFSDAVTGGSWSSSNTSVATVSTAGVVTGVASGTATITYATASGCSVTKSITVATAPSAISGGSSVCAGATTTLSDAVTGGTWSSSNTSVATVGATTGIVTGMSAGSAAITYTTSSGCYVTKPVTVGTMPSAITGVTTVCAGATTTLSDAVTGGTWSSSNTSVATVGATTGVVTGVAAGTATITYTTASGCFVTTVVTVNAAPSAITGSSSVCAGATTTLSDAVTGGTWSSSNTAVATVGATTGFVTGMSAGTATITYATSSGCAVTKVVTVGTAPSAITGLTTVCAGATTTLSDAAAGGTWSSSNTAVATIGAATGVVTGVSAGSATISYTTASGCFVSTVVTVNAAPSAITGSSSVCAGATTTLSDAVTGGTWTSSNTAVATVGATTGIVTGIAAGTATITYATGGGCSQTKVISVTGLPSAGAITGATSVAAGSSTTLVASASGGSWTSSNPAVAAVSSTGVVSGVATGSANVSYTVSNSCGSAYTMSSISVTGAANRAPYFTGGATQALSVCQNASATSISSLMAISDADAGQTETWTIISAPAHGTLSGLPRSMSSTGGTLTPTSVSYTPAVGYSGTDVFKIQISDGIATALVTVNVTISAAPSVSAIGGPTSVPVGATITLTDATAGGVWSSSNATLATVSSGGVVTGRSSGNVNIVYTVSSSCGSSAATMRVRVSKAGHKSDLVTGSDELTVRPNPTTGTFTLSAPADGVFYLVSMDGRTVGQYNVVEGDTNLNMPSGTPAGIYIGKFMAEDGTSFEVKILYKP